MEQRNRGIDLLRMTAMWMVVILHILNKGGVLAAAAPLSAGCLLYTSPSPRDRG